MTKESKKSGTAGLSDKENSKSLSDFMPKADQFPEIDKIIRSFRENNFLDLSLRKRFKVINQTLCKLIQDAPSNAFLLSAVLDYIDRVNKENVLEDIINLASFEFWLNHFSELSENENYLIRSKIVGKSIPRGDYQGLFPIGMDRTFTGSHFVAAHLSPDVDTMIASFWGWMDAFAARIGTGLHIWSLPGGPPDSPITAIIREMFGKYTFDYLARTSLTLTLTSMDLVTQKSLTKEMGNRMAWELDHRTHQDKAVILVDENGHYLGDWRISDVELVRPIVIAFKSCLHWFENNLLNKLIALFAKQNLKLTDLPSFNASVFDVKIKDCVPAQEFTERQKNDLDDFFHQLLGLENGLDSTFRDLNRTLDALSLPDMLKFQKEIENISKSSLFDSNGHLIEDRPKIFHYLDKIIKDLDRSIHQVRNYVERLDIVLGIKHKVLNLPHLYLTLRSDVEEMRQKIQHHDFLTVIVNDKSTNSLFPVGIVRSADLRKTGLGTVSLRDFCNLEEVKMASYLEVISVIDHHKSSLKTNSAPSALISDAQSCNVLLAEQAFIINDRFSLGGMTSSEIDKQIEKMSQAPISASQTRILRRLLQRRTAAHHIGNVFYINSNREFNEYLSFLHAILDDTDLLTKVSNRDVECLAQILNRLKSLSLKEEIEVVNFDDIPKDRNYAKTAAQRILKNPDMYSLYKKTYDYRESEVESNLKQCSEGKYSNIFLDTKVQNGCARVGQTKIFASNFDSFVRYTDGIRTSWLKQAQEVNKEYPEIDLHIHMVSTIASAEEVYHNQIGPYKHQDELWFWISDTQQAYDHLASFLGNFKNVAENFRDKDMHVEFIGPNADEYAQIFQQNFLNIPRKIAKDFQKGLPLAILRIKPGSVNSRKSMITPFIPRIIP
ncbi:MAG: hypothetical protein H0W88_04175 [Parachlamydiaceae bacterium]|nr:hypothetical protein [Parachlamydiaceae bacterium]